MKIGILGAGFTGLSAAYYLALKGHEVIVFEKDQLPGGLAVGYKEKKWDWSIEKHYHHWFTNDNSVIELAKQIKHKVIIKTPESSFYINKSFYKFDSPRAILSFPKLPFFDRFRMAAVFAVLFRFNPFWKPLERYKIANVVPNLIGKKAYTMLWKPQLVNKMGKYAHVISLVWFWARIRKRTTSLAYPQGGFLSFAQSLVKAVEKKGGKVLFNQEVVNIEDTSSTTISVKKDNRVKTYSVDKIIVTSPSYLFLKVCPTLPKSYKDSLFRLQGLSATNLVLRLKKPFFPTNTYWLSICEPNAPIMAIIEHTNFMDKSHYNNEHIVYIGNYATTEDKLDWPKEKILAFYDTFLAAINPDYKTSLINYEYFKAPFAQPIVPENYSRLLPSMRTPFENIYLANIEQVYPWDRGTNYAVALGKKVAGMIS